MESLLLIAFAIILITCVLSGYSMFIALFIGWSMFFFYGIHKGKTIKEMLSYCQNGISMVQTVLITFMLIGMLTAVWRSCGSIAYIVYETSIFFAPQSMIILTFLLCALVSFLIGTAFGSAATIGVICVTMANSMNIPIIYTGGAMLAGIYFGDRCSPVSTSCLLVSTLTHTDQLENIKTMFKTAAVPFIISCILYLLLGLQLPYTETSTASRDLLATHYVMTPLTLLPVITVLVLALFRVNVKITLTISTLIGLILSVLVQGMPLSKIFPLLISGFTPENSEIAMIMGGGGLISMLSVMGIVCISSSFSGMFEGTGFLDHIQKRIIILSDYLSPFGTILLVSILSATISCNQSLAIMLTNQLCHPLENDRAQFASDLENTAVVTAPLIPWSIADAVPLVTVGAPILSILTAFYLFLVPLWNLLVQNLPLIKQKVRARI